MVDMHDRLTSGLAR